MSNDHLRHDADKLRYSLLDTFFLKEMVAVLTFGAMKYQPHGWREGMDWSRVGDALARHMEEFRAGESFDKETGLHHMAHVAVNAMFLLVYDRMGLGKDNLTYPGIMGAEKTSVPLHTRTWPTAEIKKWKKDNGVSDESIPSSDLHGYRRHYVSGGRTRYQWVCTHCDASYPFHYEDCIKAAEAKSYNVMKRTAKAPKGGD